MTVRLSGRVDIASLVELLQVRAHLNSDHNMYTFLLNGEDEAQSISLSALDRQARTIATQLQQLDLAGARALLIYQPGLEYIAAFFGCLYAGVVAVPAYPPPAKRPAHRLQAILADSQAAVALTTTAILDTLAPRFPQTPDLARLRWLATDAPSAHIAAAWQQPDVSHDTLAFLQYTSGSTSAPKGVMLTHGNLLHNLELIHHGFGHTSTSQGVIWLPPYHDMGLIGGILQPLYGDFPVTLMAPVAFLQRPLRWLQAITRYRGTTSGGPNFAYELCARKITPEQRAQLDLSSWDVAFTGAEPVRAETLDRFTAAFAECGFRRSAFYPCYGLAEATLIVAGGRKAAPPIVHAFDAAALAANAAQPAEGDQPGSRLLVSSGRTLAEQQIVIADPHTRRSCAGGQIGEIWVSGPSVAQGYWGKPDLSRDIFRAQLSDGGARAFLRTGDLGFLQDGELFVTGRLKDLIIIRGRNHYPQDIELTVEQSHPAFQIGGGAAFTIEIDGEERLVVAQEVTRQARATDPQLLIDAAREAVAAQHEVQLYAAVLLKPGATPKTSSGKIQRHACRAKFLAGTLQTISSSILHDAPTATAEVTLTRAALEALDSAERLPALEAYLMQRISQTLRVAPERLQRDIALSALGIDSLQVVELTNVLETDLAALVPMTDVLEGPSIAALAETILAQIDAPPLTPSAALVETADPNAAYQLSYGQRALWFLHQLTPDSAAYNLAGAVRIGPGLDVDRLRGAVQMLAVRHPALRTTFMQAAGAPLQQTQPQLEIALDQHDAAAWSDLELHEQLVAAAERPFDLQHGPLLRIILFTRSGGEHVLLLAIHHIVSDFWSLAVLLDDLGQLYSAADAASSLAPLTLSYADYIQWQQTMLAGIEGQRHWIYWQQQIAPADGRVATALNLPTSGPRPPVQTYHGATVSGMLGQALTQQLKSFSEERGLTLYTTLVAAFHVLLYRYTGQTSFLIGSTTAGRSRARLAPLIGYFVNPVALRADLAAELPFRIVLERTRRTVLDAFAHQDYPFALLVERLQPERDPARSPLFQVMFSFQQVPRLDQRSLAGLALGESGVQLQLGALAVESLGLEQRTAQFDLTLVMAESAGGLGAVFQYNRDLFTSDAMERMLGHWMTLLQAIVVQPEQPIAALPLLTDAERRQLLTNWNATRRPYLREYCLHDLVAAQAVRSPEAVAVVYADSPTSTQQLSYRELNARANQLARYLRRRGVGGPGQPEARVGLCVERSLDLVIGLLGILKAGAAYVPLDPAYPPGRIAYVLADAGAPILVTQSHVLAALADRSDDGRSLHESVQQTICLDAEWERIAQEPPTAPPSGSRPEQLAYVIYTSGSTGMPKGVQIPHRAVINFLQSMQRRPGLSADDVLLGLTTISFDIAALEIFLPLIVGARLALASRAIAVDGAQLAALLETSRATVMQATPATWRLLLAAGWQGSSMLKMLCGGEAFPPDLAQQLQPLGAELWNMYGPTETTIWSAVHPIERCVSPTPIGRAIANTQLYVLNALLTPQPIGVVGELYIGGDGLARGYSNRPGLTAERFIPDPFSAKPGGRMYRTGDLARWTPSADGASVLECLGRSDSQVKLRGYRIELGEIEAQLAQHPAISAAAVVVRDGAGAYDQRLIAYIVRKDQRPDSAATAAHASKDAPAELPQALRAFLRDKLPEYMIPAAFVTLDALPLTPNNKIDRNALPALVEVSAVAPAALPDAGLEREIAQIWQQTLGVAQIGLQDNFFDLGGHSALVAQVHHQLQEQLGLDLALIDLFKYPTISALTTYVRQRRTPGAPQPDVPAPRPRAALQAADAIAIIGMEGRFPGAQNLQEFWRNLQQGVEAISFFSEQELIDAGVDPALVRDPNYVRARGVLADSDRFDAAFFGFNPREAELMDPQHRVFLECAWSALERAGYDSARSSGRIGVFASVGINTYLLRTSQELLGSAAQYQAFIGNDKDFVPTRVSYKLGLRGPSINVQTACSSSLVAIHLACQSLRSGEADMALVGGVAVSVPHTAGYLYEPGGIPSPDGHCRAFDSAAQGTVFGNGVGVVVLKPLQHALADGDTIHAVIRGTAINNDGDLKIGYTAPSVDGQAEVITAALAMAQLTPDDISYVEAHGTGTPLGDPIELAALNEAFRTQTDRADSVAIGSVKTNIGHLDTAAGIAGLIKTTLALTHREIPPSLHFTQPNPKIDFASSPFYVNTKLQAWPRNGAPRRAGVSSFGIGGTNAHVILEEAPELPATAPAAPWQVLPLSAKTPAALDAQTANLAAFLRQSPAVNLADVAYTLQQGRRALPHRRVLVARDAADAGALLAGADPERVFSGSADEHSPSVAFLFPGQGAQTVGMGREVYAQEPVFRATVDRCCAVLAPHLGLDLRTVLYPAPDQTAAAAAQLQQTALAQPALFVVEYALAQLWQHWGVTPAALLGHSLGEVVAATLAGVFTLEDALLLVAARGRLMQTCAPGALLSVALPAADLDALLGPDLSLAALNGPTQTVVAGSEAAIERLRVQLERQGVTLRRLSTAHAFHSPAMEPILPAFRAAVARVARHAPQRPFLSNVTGAWITAAEATDPDYWTQQLRQPVRFAAGLAALAARGAPVLLEVGPGTTLRALVRQQDTPAPPAVLSSLRHPQDQRPERAVLLSALGQLWLHGVAPAWAALHSEPRRRIPLPTYPFERQRFWIDAPKRTQTAQLRPGKQPNIADWFYAPLWKQSIPPDLGALDQHPAHWLILADGCSISAALAERLTQAGHTVTTVQPGTTFLQLTPDSYTVDPTSRAHYDQLLAELHNAGQAPGHIVHAWSVTRADQRLASETIQNLSWWSLLFLAQALGKYDAAPLQLEILTSNMQSVAGEAVLEPEKALALGPCRVIPQEHPQIRCRSIDIGLPAVLPAAELADLLLAELATAARESIVAYRGAQRWVQLFEPMPLQEPAGLPTRLSMGGVYLITGGLGGIGLTLAEYLARTVQAKLVLVGRSALPPRAEWDERLAAHAADAAASRRIRAVRTLEAFGAEVLVVNADIADPAQLAPALDQARARFGRINGVIHAAGVAGGGVVQLKTPDAAAAVLRPKVVGTLTLHALLADAELDFFVVCSSINAVVGGFGQVDYCAANAFLDAFIASQAHRHRTAYLSINWDRWPATGMAAANTSAAQLIALTQPAAAEQLDHPLLKECIEVTPERMIYRSTFAVDTHWALSEHRVAGQATVPGTTYLEMARAAFERQHPATPPEIRAVIFIAPLIVADDERRTVLTILERQGEAWSFRVVSETSGGTGLQQEHVRGVIGPAVQPAPAPIDLAEIGRRCGPAQSPEAYSAAAQEFVTAGPRWQSLIYAHLGAGEGLAALELPGEFQADLNELGLHPALLDVATGSIQRLGLGNYLPLAYDQLRIYQRLPHKLYSYVKYQDLTHSSKETLTCDILITDERGVCLVAITGFSMKRVSAEIARQIAAQAVAAPAPHASGNGRRAPGPTEIGILPDEGVSAFARLLSGRRPPQLVVSVQDLPTVIAQAQSFTAEHIAEQLAARPPQPLHARPLSQGSYKAPDNDLERRIAAIWQSVLGLEHIGIDDNFFELGGTSLSGIQIVTELKKAFAVELSPVSIFEAPTIRALAAHLSPERNNQTAFQHSLDRAERKLARKRRK